MRRLWAAIVSFFTIAIIILLNSAFGGSPALGKFLDPLNGALANAEPVNKNFSVYLEQKALQHPVTIWLDRRMVPHIRAANDHDIYYAQGYLHATFRLWQMDMETRAAAGRVSEVIGAKALKFDRTQRRKGMIYAAENSLKAIEAEPRTKLMMDAYTQGVNDYIRSLHYRDFPLEYKLMSFAPELWTSLKSALLIKYMADDLTGYTEDIPLTFLRDILPAADFNLLYPEKIRGSKPVIPAGTAFAKSTLPAIAVPDDSVWTHLKFGDFEDKRDEGKGSNNWAISGARTQSGAAILCNDPHLGLNLPSLWYEAQLQTLDMNVYGVSLPGAPGIVIGFNDSISWGLTNNYRDVKDFYAIKRVSNSQDKYWFSGRQLPFAKRPELIKIKGSKDFIDTVDYTLHGPVMYDEHFHGDEEPKMPLAMAWMAHRPTNEILALYLLNRARNYDEYVSAILNFQCPAQNLIYADRNGNIALWGQGQFINKWQEQGRFIMNGADSAALWQQLIPMRENPHVLNPAQGYLTSANEAVTDSTYPYWYNGTFYELRAWRINQVLSTLNSATIQDMFALQNDTYSILAANTLPVMLQNLPADKQDNKYIALLRAWDYRLAADSKAATVYQIWWDRLYNDIWKDEFAKVPSHLYPLPERTMQLMQTDTALKFYDDITTPAHERLRDIVLRSYKETLDSINKLEKTTGLGWYKVKNTGITHLTKLQAFSYPDLKIGGWGNTVNAAKHDHGPSWRMVVQMGKTIDAYGVYPGGQSGNPGSKYYADFLQHWVDGQYYRLLFLPNEARQDDPDIRYVIKLQP